MRVNFVLYHVLLMGFLADFN